MAGYVVFGLFVVAMIVLAVFVTRFSIKINRDRSPRRRR